MKLLMHFAEPTLKKLLKHFCNNLGADSEIVDEKAPQDGIPVSLSSKVLPDSYYTFAQMKVYSKIRRLGYHIDQTEQITRRTLHDELKFYGTDLYDFSAFDEENPVVVACEDEEETTKTAGEKEEVTDKTEETKDEEESLIKVKSTTEEEDAANEADEAPPTDTEKPVEDDGKPAEIKEADTAVKDTEKRKVDAAREAIKGKFEIDFNKLVLSEKTAFSLDSFEQAVEYQTQPLLRIVKTLHSLAKVHDLRMDVEPAADLLSQIMKILKNVTQSDSEDSLLILKVKYALMQQYLKIMGPDNKVMYDPEDRPMKLATEIQDSVEKILEKDTVTFNYLRGKAIAAIGKVYLVQKKGEKAEEFFLKAQAEVAAIYGDDSPLCAKFNSFLIEAYNFRQESPART